jgi:hypothetical protein
MEFLDWRLDAYLARPNGLDRKFVFTAMFERSCEHQSPRGPVRSAVRTPLRTPKPESFCSQPVRTPEQTTATSRVRVRTLTYPVRTALEINADLSSFCLISSIFSFIHTISLRFFTQKP